MKILGNKEEADHIWLTIEADPKTLESVYYDHFKNVSNKVNIPGFRKGHAPMSMVIQSLKNTGRWVREFEVVVNRVIERSVEKLGKEFKEWDEKIFGYPVDSKLNEFNSEKWIMVFDAKFEKFPVVKLADYSCIDTLIEYKEPDINTCPVTTDKEVEANDIVAVAMIGKNPEGESVAKYTYDMLEIDLEKTKIDRSIIDILIGCKAKDKRELKVQYRDQEISLEIWVIEVRKKEKVDEELAKKLNLSSETTVEKLQEAIKKQHDIHNSYVRYQDIMKWLFSKENKVEPLPIENLKRESAKAYNNLIKMGRKNVSFENIMYEQTRNLKTTLVLNEIAKKEKFEATDEDKINFAKDIETQPWLYGNSKTEDIFNCSEEMLKEYVLQFKTINFLIERWIFSS